ncbi:energy-coupling factor ABC transporter ATP-binding protein [Yoonia vestfoldensis]|uniref:ABC transporter n=1 Tax=Yoonia vestfoldensis SKA53 TaxID=314232 RepID=A3V5M1_9RHOB|nr:ABC transporter ATP-binding protein [Yoonia vestfoldensis]EAQ06939.1 ABC transporter [Yoonia vestfoldensis SKA53]
MTMSLLHTTDLTLTRATGERVLHDISLRIAQGERVGLIGPNGAGKTTLMLCLTGVIRASAGAVQMDGKPVTPGGFHPDMGFVFQQAEDQLFSPTVAEDVAFGARNLGLSGAVLDRAVATALDRVGITGLADRPVHHLSGGEKRLACLAGVLVMDPRLLLLDEPSAALDLRNRRRLIDLLRGMDQAMLIASHDLELVLELCPRVILIDAGRIVADGAARSVLGDAALMARHGQEVPHSLIYHARVDHAHPRHIV